MKEFLNNRKIIHIDMDAFYASVEQLDNPQLRGKPVAVGGLSDRGVVAAASYEARKFGVYSAMSGKLARLKCKQLIFVKPRFERYKQISNKIRNIFKQYTDLIEPLSLDEAYLDVTSNKKNIHSASKIARLIREQIYNETKLTASAGISINKFLAKTASDINKPNGQKTILPDEVESFLEELPIEKFYGIGKVTTTKMYNLGIFTGKDLKTKSKDFLIQHFKKSGAYYYNIVRGIQHTQVTPNRKRKSVAAEHTFSYNLTSEVFMLEKLKKITDELEQRLKKSKVAGKTITLKIKYNDFTQETRSKTIKYFIKDKEIIFDIVKELLYQKEMNKSVRLLGISIANLNVNAKKTEKMVNVQLRFNF